MYRLHNYHLTVWAAMFDGQYSTAMEYAEAAEQQLGPDAVICMVGDLPIGSMYLEATGLRNCSCQNLVWSTNQSILTDGNVYSR